MVEGLDKTYLEITVNGHVVPCEYWSRLKPKAGATVNIRTYPQGKTVRKVIAIVVIIVVAYFTGPASAGFWSSTGLSATGIAVAQVAISVVGSLIVQALVKPTMPKLSSSDKAGDTDRANSITGTSNTFAPFNVQPCVIGETRFFPPQCAMPYTEMFGDDQYLRMLLDLGPGDLAVSEVNIGDDDIGTFTDVEYEFGPDPQLYTNDVFELAVGANLPNDGDISPPKTCVTPNREVVVEVAWPQGLFGATKEGKDVKVSMSFAVQYRLQGSSTWLNMSSVPGLTISHEAVTISADGGNFICASSARKMIRCSIRMLVALNPLPYEVRVMRLSTAWANSDKNARIGDFGWVTLKSVNYTNPSNLVSTKLAVRIKATDQLNGTVSTLNCRVQQNIKQWNGTAWVVGPTNNPAWLYLWLLTACPANPRLMDETRVDIPTLKLWAVECANMGLEYANVIDAQTTVFDLLNDICAAGRASFGVKDGLYSVVRDVQQSTPVQVFTPRNSWEFTGSRVFSEEVHGLKCSFMNTQQGWQKDMRIVYAEGYNATNASKFEELDMRGIKTPEAAWRLGSYHLAVAKYRQNSYSFKCDFENLICQRGDLILVSHPVCNWGNGWGRVSTVTPASGSVTSLTMDEDISLIPFEDNVLRVRRDDGTTVLSSIKTDNMIFHPSMAYTRNSDATYRGFDGSLAYAEPNTARYAYDALGNALGVQMERAATNYALWSETLSDPTWVKGNCNLDYTGGVAPDGFTLCHRLLANTANAQHYIEQVTPNPSASSPVTFSVWAKSDGLRYLTLRIANAAGTAYATRSFDLLAGTKTVTTHAGTAFTLNDSQIDAWQDGWYRCSVTVVTDASTTVNLRAYMGNADNSGAAFVGANSGIRLWGFQAEGGYYPSSYIPTSGATATRVADLASMSFTDASATLVVEYTPTKYATTQPFFQYPVSLNDGTVNNRIHIRYRPDTDVVESVVTAGSALQASLTSPQHVPTYRVAMSYATNNFMSSCNGAAVVTDTSGTVPTINRMEIGSDLNGGFTSGFIKMVRYFPTAQTSATLQQWSNLTFQFDEDTITLLSPMSGVQVGDLAVAGVRNEESGRMVVTRVEPASNLTATITCVDEAPSVYTAGIGTPPGFVSTITNQPWCPAPLPPLITAHVTTGTGDGSDGGGGKFGDHPDTGGTGRPGVRITLRSQSKPSHQVAVGTVMESTFAVVGSTTISAQAENGAGGSAVSMSGTSTVTGNDATVATRAGTSVNGVVLTGRASKLVLAQGASLNNFTTVNGFTGSDSTYLEATGTSFGNNLPVSLLRFNGADQSTTTVDDTGLVWTMHGTMRLDASVQKFIGNPTLLLEGSGFGGYLSTPYSPSIDISTGDFTLEYFYYPDTLSTLQQHVDFRPSGGTSVKGLVIQQPAASPESVLVQIGSPTDTTVPSVSLSSTTLLLLNQWAHIAVVRSGSTVSLFLNGHLEAQATFAGTVNVANAILQLGANRNNAGWVDGRYANFRLTTQALYLANFTPPVSQFGYTGLSVRGQGQALQFGANAVDGNSAVVTAPALLLRMEGVNNQTTFPDDSGIQWYPEGGIKMDNIVSKFGTATTGVFDGINDAVATPLAPRIDISTGDFTLEYWIYPGSTATATQAHVEYKDPALLDTDYSGLIVRQRDTDPTHVCVSIGDGTSTTAYNLTLLTVNTVQISTWYHVAVVRSGTTVYLFLNGHLEASGTFAGTINLNNAMLYLGRSVVDAYMTARMAGFRLHTRALYTSDFTVPTSQYVFSGVSCRGDTSLRWASRGTTAGTSTVTGASAIVPKTGTVVAADGTSTTGVLPESLVTFVGVNQSSTMTDLQGRAWTTHGTMRLDNSVADPWGGTLTTMLLEGTGNGGYATTPFTDDLDISNTSFTVAYWYRPNNVSALQEHLDFRQGGTVNQGLIICQSATNPTKINFTCGSDVDTTTFEVNLLSTTPMVVGTWYHIACQRRGNIFTLYINGIAEASTTFTGEVSVNGGLLQIGANRTNAGWVDGRYSNLRITREALYPGNFTPPTAPLLFKGVDVAGLSDVLQGTGSGTDTPASGITTTPLTDGGIQLQDELGNNLTGDVT